VRKFTYSGNYAYIADGAGRLETRNVEGSFDIEFQNSDSVSARYQSNYEFLERPFTVGGVSIPTGRYDFRDGSITLFLGTQRQFTGSFSLQRGGYYNGGRRRSGSAAVGC
jgi:hypothetical protein